MESENSNEQLREDGSERRERRRESNEQTRRWQEVFLGDDMTSVFINNTHPRADKRRYGFVPIKPPATQEDMGEFECEPAPEPPEKDRGSSMNYIGTKEGRSNISSCINIIESPAAEDRPKAEKATGSNIDTDNTMTDKVFDPEGFELVDCAAGECRNRPGRFWDVLRRR